MLNNQGYSVNESGILNLKVGDVFKVEHTSPTPESRDDLSGFGNIIRENAGSEFSKNLFENYWNGGGDIELTDERFAGILLYVKKNATQESEGSRVNIVSQNGNIIDVGSQKLFDFYSSSEYDKAFGKATLFYNSKGNVIGFYDCYDFDSKSWGERSYKNEIITRSVSYASPEKARSFIIRSHYSIRKK